MNIPVTDAIKLLEDLITQPIAETDDEYIRSWKKIRNQAIKDCVDTLKIWAEMEGRKIAQFNGETND